MSVKRFSLWGWALWRGIFWPSVAALVLAVGLVRAGDLRPLAANDAVGDVAGERLYQGERAWHRGQKSEAVRLWQPLAEQGVTRAQMYLGYAYFQGLGVAQDVHLSSFWYRRAAESGDAAAQYQLGLAYEVGLGVERDMAEADFWYGLAVAQGFCPGELSDSGGLE